MQQQIKEQIEKRTKESAKHYGFDNAHNPRLPADWWFQQAPEGLVFFLVFYTQACRWAQCLGCNLPSKVSSESVGFKDIMRQVDFVFNNLLSAQQLQELRKVIISNNGSVLDEVTLSTTALVYFIARLNEHCPQLRVLTIETRPEYVDWDELELLHRIIGEGETPTDLEVAIGFEAFDDKIRNEYFHKGLELSRFEELARRLAKYRFRLKAYFMQKPVPGLSEQEALADIVKGIGYLDKVAREYELQINLHLNPTYAAAGTQLAVAFKEGRYTPPLLDSVRQAVLAAEQTRISVYIGLNDEGLAVPGGSFLRPGDEALVQRLEAFNRTQDYSLLR